MTYYDYGRIRVLAKQLEEAGVAQDVMDKILEGGESILGKTTPKMKADWMREAMKRMDDLLDPQTKCSIREGCACCLGGKRLKISQGIAKTYQSLESRTKAANEAKFVFGHSVTMQDDGKILVRFEPEGLDHYRCVCLPKANDEPISITYCYCCGGHVKHHLQTALGVALSCEVISSPLESGGKKPCTFLFTVADSE